MKYVTCVKCGKIDKPVKAVISTNYRGVQLVTTPHNPGTSVKMQCPDCKDTCRACCPTHHQTKWSSE